MNKVTPVRRVRRHPLPDRPGDPAGPRDVLGLGGLAAGLGLSRRPARPGRLAGSWAGRRSAAPWRSPPPACRPHEFGAFGGRDHVVDIVEAAAAALVDHVQEAERPGAAVAQDELRDRAAELARRRRPAPPASRQCSSIVAPSRRASTIAWLAPLEPVGYIAWAASPRSSTAPSTPGRHRIAVDHRVLVGHVGAAQQRRAHPASRRSSRRNGG